MDLLGKGIAGSPAGSSHSSSDDTNLIFPTKP